MTRPRFNRIKANRLESINIGTRDHTYAAVPKLAGGFGGFGALRARARGVRSSPRPRGRRLWRGRRRLLPRALRGTLKAAAQAPLPGGRSSRAPWRARRASCSPPAAPTTPAPGSPPLWPAPPANAATINFSKKRRTMGGMNTIEQRKAHARPLTRLTTGETCVVSNALIKFSHSRFKDF